MTCELWQLKKINEFFYDGIKICDIITLVRTVDINVLIKELKEYFHSKDNVVFAYLLVLMLKGR